MTPVDTYIFGRVAQRERPAAAAAARVEAAPQSRTGCLPTCAESSPKHRWSAELPAWRSGVRRTDFRRTPPQRPRPTALLSFIVRPTLTLAVTARQTVRTAGKPADLPLRARPACDLLRLVPAIGGFCERA